MNYSEDTTQYWEPPALSNRKVSNKGKCSNNWQLISIKKLYRRKKRSRISRRDAGVQSKKEKRMNVKTKTECCPNTMCSKLVNTKQTKFDKKSLISLYRQRKTCKTNKRRLCKCRFEDNPHINENNSADKNKQFEMIPKNNNTCEKGLCPKGIKLKDKNFACSCEMKTKTAPPVKCTNKSGHKDNKLVRKNSVVKIKEKVSDILRKCSKRIKIRYGRNEAGNFNKTDEQSVCKNQNKHDICNECKHKDNTYSSKNKSSGSLTLSQKLRNKLKAIHKQSTKHHIQKCVVVQNEVEQTGDPLFEIKVNPMDMCVLNSSEIKDKVISLGHEKKREKCVCPSHAVKRQYILEREACLSGACQKALKHKQTNFTCKCLKNKVWTCTDSTCDKAEPLKKHDNCLCVDDSSKEHDKPLFEMQFDSNNMCIINTNEMRLKMEDIKRRNNKLCRSGICKDKSEEPSTRVVCNCKKSMKYDECAEDTCRLPQKCCKCGKHRNKKTMRNNLDTASLRNITSKVSGFCARMLKSDNWINRQKKRRKRHCRRCNNSIARTQSENVHKRDGLKIMIKKQNNECYDNCCPCDNGMRAEKPKRNMGDMTKSPQITPTKPAAKKKVRQRNRIIVPVSPSKLNKIQAICQCHHICECALEEHKRKMKEKQKSKGYNRGRSKRKKKASASSDKKWTKEIEKRKQFAKDRNKAMKEENKRRKNRMKEEMEVLKLLESKDGARDTNCCVEIFGTIFSIGFHTIKIFFGGLFKIITDPKGSYWYTRERMQDPQGTLISIKRYVRRGWRIRKLKITKCMNNSETVSILSDTFKESPVYQAFADRGKTKKEQDTFAMESKKRKKRVRHRQDAAIYGCRHALLTTLRKTPCLWVYHVCPEFYPQCLSCLAFTRNFWHLCLFVLAFACWTPCIVFCEAMRGLCCCLLCTG
ncbi:uncharacterized protein LOC114361415 [Ostrinia furnacalis]|uniref:uncharacterized protein LOC114361415 n=1 Tax=Ostrinia furnacalis TaxID=93504 RepID=UPI00103FAFEF|nr:uncharacterized protein LOC114361415 [Ostrinia furnacalis]